MAKGSYGNPKSSSVSLRDKKRSQAMRGQASTSTGVRSAKPINPKKKTKAKAPKAKMERMESKGAASLASPKATDTQVNKRMSQAIESARSEESLLDGKDRRRVERKARIQDRAETRTRRSELQDKYGKKLGRQVSRAENNPKVKERAAKKTRKSELKSTYGKGVGKAKFKAEYASDKQKRKAASKTARSKKMSEAKSAVKSAKASLKEARRR